MSREQRRQHAHDIGVPELQSWVTSARIIYSARATSGSKATRNYLIKEVELIEK